MAELGEELRRERVRRNLTFKTALTPVSLMINIITIAPTYGNRRNTSLLILDLIPGAT